MSKHKQHIPKSDSFLNKVFSKEQSKEDYTDLEWEAKQGLDQLGEEGAIEALARIQNRIESQKRIQSKKPTVIPLWRYGAAAACAGILIFFGNQLINSTTHEGPISYDAQETQTQDIPSDEGSAPSTEAIQETFADESIADESSSMKDGVIDDATSSPNSETEVKDNAVPTTPPPPPAEPALRTNAVEEEITTEAELEERIFEVASEDMVVLELPNDVADNSSSQGSAVIEQEENPPVAFTPDEMAPNDVMADEMLPEMTYRMSEKNSLSMEGMADSDAHESLYDWRIAFAEKQFQEITLRFEKADWAQQHTNEEAMFFAARAYHALSNLNQATAIMQEVVHLQAEKAEEAKRYLEQWKK